eukprot:gb/GFBE01077011.1/.p1 GENE.gb/GFBE01077011.1/~~gb/GFBE01077011.1/.p1  ORF type:complete len:392 (+),score=72.51 gb/GFBE01077011.1/:1-1176(+)
MATRAMGMVAAAFDRLRGKGESSAAVFSSKGRQSVSGGRQSQGGAKRRRQSLSTTQGRKRRATGAASAASPQVARWPCPAEAADAAASSGAFPLAALAAGPYIGIASFLDPCSLGRADAACRLLKQLNNLPTGPWHTIGEQTYYGMELDVVGGFQSFEQVRPGSSESWKARCALFSRATPSFSSPFLGSEIARVDSPDEVAYCRCRLRSDLLAIRPDRGIYVEVEVHANADNLSLAVVDFEGGGRSSVTFSPETGAVLRERKVRESPRAIEGTYIHLLPPAMQGRRFEGTMGLFLKGGHLSFFRRWRSGPEAQAPAPGGGAWETTGFCTDLKWAQGPRLSLCLAFRDSGAYRVLISKVGSEPPLVPPPSSEAYQESKWSLLYGDDDHPLAI